MISVVTLSMAMMAGQANGPDPLLAPPPVAPRNVTLPSVLPSAPARMPSVLTSTPTTLPSLPSSFGQPPVPNMPMPIDPKAPATRIVVPMPTTPMPVTTIPTMTAPMATIPTMTAPVAPAAEEKKEEEPAAPEKYFFMKMLENTPLGKTFDDNKLYVSGWTTASYTGSSNRVTNAPVAWNDRANRFLLQQSWLRFGKALDTESKEVSFGFQIDLLYGSDYRFTLPRGLLNSQLLSADGTTQNLYGIDPIQFYAAAYLPNLFEGTEVRVGRLFTPWGYESLESVSTPLMSRSYAFNSAPPFTNTGIMFLPTFSKTLSGKFMIANGNDVFIDNSQELRGLAAISYLSEDKKTGVTLAASIGRGKFNAGEPFNPATASLMSEPAGRNNFNNIDLVITQELNCKLSYAVEMIYGYQTGVPSNVAGGIIRQNTDNAGTAKWGSIAQYFTYKYNDKVSGILRGEVFDDFDGQRTGFEGLYTAVTAGIQYRPTNSIIFRPEIRYDHNGYSRPFEGKHQIVTAGADLTIRY